MMAKSNLLSAKRHPAGFFEARARPETGRHGEILASFLQSDVQADLATARALLDEVAATGRGEAAQPGGAGNAFSITISSDGVVIRNAVMESAQPEHYTLEELQAALETWIDAIEPVRRRHE